MDPLEGDSYAADVAADAAMAEEAADEDAGLDAVPLTDDGEGAASADVGPRASGISRGASSSSDPSTFETVPFDFEDTGVPCGGFPSGGNMPCSETSHVESPLDARIRELQ